jgi:O-antigen/teichoic acid export membrane protein
VSICGIDIRSMDHQASAAAVDASSPIRALRRRGGLWLGLERLARHGAWFAVFVVLAPILGPRDYGLFVLALAGIAIAETMLSEVASDAIAALPAVEPAHLSTAFLANTAAGAVLSLLLYAVAGQFAAMTDNAALSDIYQSLALLPVLSALTAVPLALLKRRGSYAPLFAASLIGAGLGGGAGIALATVGGGGWSLVAQIVTQRFVEIIVLWAGAGRMIGLNWSSRHLRDLFDGVTPLVLTPGWSALGRQLPRFMIGLMLGPTAAGLYMLASRIAEALIEIGAAPAAAAMRRAVLTGVAPEDDAARVRRKASAALCRAGYVAVPAILGSTALLVPGLTAALDPYWWGAVMPAQILILAAVPAAITTARTAAVLASGAAAAEGGWVMLQTLTGVAMAVPAIPYGLVAVATMVLIHAIIAAAASLWPLRRALGRTLPECVSTAAQPFVATAIAGIAMLAFEGVPYPSFPPFVALALLVGAVATGYGLMHASPVWPRLAAGEP